MKSFNTLRTEAKETKFIGGLHQAQVGDAIHIGIEGSRGKWYAQIVKIAANDRLMDSDGNVFGRNGVIYRRGKSSLWRTKGKITSAKIITQKEFDKKYKDHKIDFLRRYAWDTESVETILGIISKLKIGQGNTLGKSRFSK